jgi:hypothetical protein
MGGEGRRERPRHQNRVNAERRDKLAREIARNQGADVVIYDKKGKFCRVDSYGNDPFPPLA